jgi:hypothetical protein
MLRDDVTMGGAQRGGSPENRLAPSSLCMRVWPSKMSDQTVEIEVQGATVRWKGRRVRGPENRAFLEPDEMVVG